MNIERTTALVLLCILTRAPATQSIRAGEPETEFVFGFDLDDVENDGEISGVPGHTLSARGYVTLHSPEASVSGWSFGFGASGAGVSIADWIVDGCDKACLSDLLRLEPGDVFFHYRESVDPSVENQGPGVVSSVALRPFPLPTAILPAGVSRVLPFGLEVQVSEERPGQTVTLEFRDGLVGSREPVDVDIRIQSGTVDAVLRPLRFHVRPTEPLRLAFELDGIENGGEVEAVAGETLSVMGHVALDSPVAGVNGWTFGLGANGAEVSFDEETIDSCDPACLADLLGLDADDVFFHTSQVVDPSVSDQGPGIVTAVALSVFPSQATLPRGVSRLLPFTLEVRVPEAPEGEIEIIELEFRDGLIGSGQPVSIGINLENRSVNPVLDSYRFGVLPVVFPRFVRGDCNENGSVDIADAICLLDWLFAGTPRGCLALSDTNGDMAVDVSDPISLLLFLFLGRVPPPEPFPECGPGKSEADELLGCETPPEVCQ